MRQPGVSEAISNLNQGGNEQNSYGQTTGPVVGDWSGLRVATRVGVDRVGELSGDDGDGRRLRCRISMVQVPRLGLLRRSPLVSMCNIRPTRNECKAIQKGVQMAATTAMAPMEEPGRAAG